MQLQVPPTPRHIRKFVDFSAFSMLSSKRGQASKLIFLPQDRAGFNTSKFFIAESMYLCNNMSRFRFYGPSFKYLGPSHCPDNRFFEFSQKLVFDFQLILKLAHSVTCICRLLIIDKLYSDIYLIIW